MKTNYQNTICTFDNIIFDLDSTLVTIEGIDELARMKGVERDVERMTKLAMNGESNVEDIFVKRLEIIKPRLSDVEQLTQLYLDHLTTGATQLIDWLHEQGKHVFIVSGGYDPAVTPFAEYLGISADHSFANRLHFDKDGCYQGLRKNDYLWKENGKTKIIAEIKEKFPGKTVIIGDGMSDFESAEENDTFICFAGVAQREAVMEQSTYIVSDENLTEVIQFLM